VSDNENANSETDLIRRAQAQDTDAFCVLAERHARRIYLLAFHYCQNAQDAEDLSQEVWLKAYQALQTFRSDSSFYTWLRRITINSFLNHQRNNSIRNDEQTDLIRLLPIDGVESAHYVGPDDTVYSKALFRDVIDALADLTPSQRLMFLLRHYEGMSYEEIGTAMSCSPGTAKKSVWRALGKLRAKFEVGDDAARERIARLAAEY
jgi:RNA polymerase sigma-70 factor (ECF subfamily)